MPTAQQDVTVAERTTIDHLQQALDDLDMARERVGEEARTRIDEAGERMRASVAELRRSVEHRADEWQKMLERSADEARRDLAIIAIRAQRTPASLTVLSRAIRERRAELAARGGEPTRARRHP